MSWYVLTAHESRGFLRGLYRAAAGQGLSLSDALYSALDSRYATIKNGALVVSSSTNGHSFTVAAPESFSALSLVGYISRLIDILEQANTALVAAGTATPTDAELLAQMLTDVRLRSIRCSTPDFSRFGINSYVRS